MCGEAVVSNVLWICLRGPEYDVVLYLDVQQISGRHQHSSECEVFR